MHGAIAKEGAFDRSKREFSCILRTKVRPACTSKGAKRAVIRFFLKKTLHGYIILDDLARKDVDKISGGKESLIPIF